ncbi:hypothetical protein M9458_054590 [Cirrhinus mrigala]|uniref:Reverse transcriptase domain-containing protein n=1 Tax=Cirrhinus mrigala TaxID=683832 RepID=A0ABD0MM24_CIRMR
MSLRLQKVPLLWKTSYIVPVPKKSCSSDPKDYRPVALMSHIMKILERLVLEELRPTVRPCIDVPPQPHLRVEDAIIYMLARAYTHLEKAANTVRVMFFDFSSAFNTIRLALQGEKLIAMRSDASLVPLIVNYLTGRPQYVRLRHRVSDRVVCNTGAPKGTVLSPSFFTLYTADFSYCTESCHLQKFSDDSAIVGCFSGGEETEYRTTAEPSAAQCDKNNGAGGRIAEDYGTYDPAVYKKPQSRLYFLRRLRSFNICRTMLKMFYESVVASAIFFAVVCRGSGLKVADANRLNKFNRKAASVVGVELEES